MNTKKILSIILLLIVVFSTFSYATEKVNTEDVMLINEENDEGSAIPEEWRRTGAVETEKNNTVIDQSHFMVDENASLKDTIINGNLFVFGTNVSLNNVVIEGEVFIVGQNVTLSDVTVNGTGFIVGEITNMNIVNFTGNIFNVAQTINFIGNARDVFAVAEDMAFTEGTTIARDVFATATRIVFDASVGKDVNISGKEIILMENTNILGTLNYSSEQEAGIPLESNIGKVNFNKIEQEVEETTSEALNPKVYNVVTIAIKSIFVCGFIFLFGKSFMEKQKVSNIGGYLGKNTLTGLGWAIIIPIIAILLLFTGVSVGLSFTVFAVYCILFWASVPIISIVITSNITSKQAYNAWRFFGYSILISIIIAILKQLPKIGGVVTVVVGFAAIGIVLSSLKKKKIKVENISVEVENGADK